MRERGASLIYMSCRLYNPMKSLQKAKTTTFGSKQQFWLFLHFGARLDLFLYGLKALLSKGVLHTEAKYGTFDLIYNRN